MRSQRTRYIGSGCLLGWLSFGMTARAEPTQSPSIHLELATLDVPNTGTAAYAMPSAQQSLWLTLDAFQLVNYGMGALSGFDESSGVDRILPGAAIAGANLVMSIVPFGLAWQHELWHKAVLSSQRIESRANSMTVSGVSDEALAALKRDHPAEFVRLQTAGIEGTYEAATALEKTQFFRHTRAWNVPTLWLFYGLNSFYLQMCASKLSDDDAGGAAKQSDVLSRDIVGSDCTGWTYDLFHSTEPYAQRGPHPSGNGIRRYRTWSDLAPREKEYLGRQRDLSLLNLLDPALLGFSAFETGKLRYNAHVRHMPTSFGSLLALDGFFASKRTSLFVSLQNFFNYEHWSPGLSAELWRFPFRVAPQRTLSASLTINGWLQPEQQRFFASKRTPGGLVRLRIDFAGPDTLEPFVEVEGKTSGWAPGMLTLDPVMALRMGVGVPIF